MKDKIYNEFYKFIKGKIENKDPEYYNNDIHVSGLYGCLRANVMRQHRDKFKSKERTLAEYIQLYFGVLGHKMIEEFAESLSDNVEFIGSEIDLTEYLPKGIAGRMDLLVKDKATGKYYLLDLKTMRPNAFKFGNLVKESYIVQTNTYLKGLVKKDKAYKDAELLLIAMDRSGTNDMQVLDIPKLDEKVVDNIIEQNLYALKIYNDLGILPNKELPKLKIKGKPIDNKLTWQCGYCEFYNISCEGKD